MWGKFVVFGLLIWLLALPIVDLLWFYGACGLGVGVLWCVLSGGCLIVLVMILWF